MFKIFTTDETVKEPAAEGARVTYGKIVIDAFEETFIASLDFWTKEQYKRRWQEALSKLVEGADRSALITSYVKPPVHPGPDDFLVWWPLYREGEIVYVQNEMLFFARLRHPFSEEGPWESIHDRRVVNAEGARVSEWAATVRDIRDFLRDRSQD